MDILKQIYYDPKTGYLSRDKLYQKVKDKGITRKQVSEFLEKQKVQQLYGDIKNYFNSFVVDDKNIQWQMDVGFFKQYPILFLVDVFSKWAYFERMKNETGEEVVRVLENAMKKMRPLTIYSDNGRNFESKIVREYLDDKGIVLIFSDGRHAPFAERLIRTIKTMLQKSYKIGMSIDELIRSINENYNGTEHTTIQIQPNEALKESNRPIIFERINDKAKRIPKKKELKVGDNVRIKIEKETFDKGYTMKWSNDIDEIAEVKGQRYRLQDKDGLYYNNQLKKISGVEQQEEAEKLVQEKKKKRRLRDELKIGGKLKIIDGKRRKI